MRKEYWEIKKLATENNCNQIFSWSKYKTYLDDTYTYYLRYIAKIPPDRFDGIYAKSGSDIHECIESFYKGELDHQGMLDRYENLLFENTMNGLKYDRSDEEKNQSVGEKYENCIRHFLLNHNPIKCDKGKIQLEEFMGSVIGDTYFQGYIDAFHIEKRDGKYKIIITDWKSSSIYKGEKYDHEKGQLLLYIESVHQQGVPYEDIVARWNFLKYVNVTVTQANGKTKVRQIERYNYVSKLESSIKMWLKKLTNFSDEERENMILNCISENSLKSLPQEVQDKFIVDDCYVEIDFSVTEINDLKTNIIQTINEIKDKEEKYNNLKDIDMEQAERIWWQDVDDKSSFFMANLSDYSANLHKPYKEYLDNREMFLNNNEQNTNDSEEDEEWLTMLGLM